MTDAMAADHKEEGSTDAGIVELGSFSEETRGSMVGVEYDGGFGWFG